MNEVLQAITTVGFPIVACIGLAWFTKYMVDNYRKDMAEANKEHKAETEKLAQAVQNNTEAINQLMLILSNKDKD